MKRNIIFFTGAGISVESGIPTFEEHKRLMEEIDKRPRTVKEIYDEFGDGEKEVFHAMVGQFLEIGKVDFDKLGDEARVVYRGFTEEQRRVVDVILAEAAK